MLKIFIILKFVIISDIIILVMTIYKEGALTDIYFDNSSTTAVDASVAEYTVKCMSEIYGNPSSLHRLGVDAEKLLNSSRTEISSALGCTPEEVCFTASGTESNNTAVFGAARMKRRIGNKIIISSYEHPSVDEAVKFLESDGFEAVRLPLDESGRVSPQKLAEVCDDKTILVAVMMVNNEIGAINDIASLVRTVRSLAPNAIFHCDAVQGFGKLPFSCKRLGIDTLSVSAHKIHAPKGVGALYIKKGLRLPPYLFGGGQESGRRSSTEATSLIAGFSLASRIAHDNITKNLEKVAALRDLLTAELMKIPQITINSPENALPYILNASIGKVRSETMLHFLERQNIFVSSGSACSKGALSRSLKALKLPPERIDSAIRISFSRYNTESEVYALVEKLREGLSVLFTK